MSFPVKPRAGVSMPAGSFPARAPKKHFRSFAPSPGLQVAAPAVTSSAYVNGTWYDIAWAPEIETYCAISYNGAAVAVSRDGGLTWTLGSSSANVQWVGICWSPYLRQFCAVSQTGTAAQQIQTSPDGLTWTAQTAPAAQNWTVIVWAEELRRFCAISRTATQNSMVSADGKTWTPGNNLPSEQWSVCWSPERRLFCAVGTLAKIHTSRDGLNWTRRTAAPLWAANSIWGLDVCWSSDLGLFCAVPYTASNFVMTSPDGMNWTTQPLPSTVSLRTIAWSPEMRLFLGTQESASTVFYSPNGSTWKTVTGFSTIQRHIATSSKFRNAVFCNETGYLSVVRI